MKHFSIDEKVNLIKNEIVDSILRMALYLIPIGIVGMTLRTLVTGWLLANTINMILVITLFIVSLFRKRISSQIKSVVLVYALIAVGWSILFHNGLLSFAPIYFLTAIGLSLILQSKWQNIGVVVTILFITFITGINVVFEKILPQYDVMRYLVSPVAWVTTTINISILAGVFYFALRKYNNSLIELMEKNSIVENQLIEQSKNAAIGQMISGIAHQWRQPINSIALIAQHLDYSFEKVKDEKETVHKALNDILETTVYMSDTIESFRSFLQEKSSNSFFNPAQSIKHALVIIEARMKKYNITLTKNILMEDIYLRGVSNRFLQIVLNLLNNSIDALNEFDRENMKIDICLRIENENMILEIIDNGPGFRDDQKDLLFEPFYSTKNDALGTGLGLFIVKDIVQKDFNGFVDAYNSQNGGATFKITIPLKENLWQEHLTNN